MNAPNQRTFSLNSREFYEAVTEPPDPNLWGPSLPHDRRPLTPQVIIEPSAPKQRERRG